MIQIMSERDAEKIVAFMNQTKNEKNVLKDMIGIPINNPVAVRALLFQTDLVCVADVDSNAHIQKLLCITPPRDVSNKLSIVICYMTVDREFFDGAIDILHELFEDEPYTKLKISMRSSDYDMLKALGFEEELQIDTKYYKQFTYSYFL